MSTLKRRNTIEQAHEIGNTFVDPKLKERYGTSIDEFMDRAYGKELQGRIKQLREQFVQMNEAKDYDGNRTQLNFQEYLDFFQERNVFLFNLFLA